MVIEETEVVRTEARESWMCACGKRAHKGAQCFDTVTGETHAQDRCTLVTYRE